ncbi:hypothetical protein [Roseomonas fluvialis]|uniref:Lipoprotein n=1 Tax=Roseomonas fluvialis TaxID=1750527 RepID=A0ABM7XZY4_9PROT|nr:hypothetical protein [Roseomonas fluvialis]BDG71078.1 hypothetical protein Rmf_10070 [Roseomonas fluvialis]
MRLTKNAVPRLVAVLLLAVLGACAARTQAGRSEAAPQVWRPTAAKGAWLIAGHMDTQRVPAGIATTPRHEVVITVNGTPAMRAEMPRDRPVELSGSAEGSALAAMCAPRMLARATVEVTCLVLVDNERAASLVFTAGTRRSA